MVWNKVRDSNRQKNCVPIAELQGHRELETQQPWHTELRACLNIHSNIDCHYGHLRLLSPDLAVGRLNVPKHAHTIFNQVLKVGPLRSEITGIYIFNNSLLLPTLFNKFEFFVI